MPGLSNGAGMMANSRKRRHRPSGCFLGGGGDGAKDCCISRSLAGKYGWIIGCPLLLPTSISVHQTNQLELLYLALCGSAPISTPTGGSSLSARLGAETVSCHHKNDFEESVDGSGVH